jgi:mono/diheme cytochrome c family protein
MHKSFVVSAIAAVFSVSAQAASLPGDTASGKKLYQANCTSCHNDSVHTRKDHTVKSLQGLTEQIHNCEHMTDVKLEKNQVNDLVKYLNETYYKFK